MRSYDAYFQVRDRADNYNRAHVIGYVGGSISREEYVDYDLSVFHTFRLEIQDNLGIVSIDNEIFTRDDNNKLLSVDGGEVAISSENTLRLEISGVRVIAGDNGGSDKPAGANNNGANDSGSGANSAGSPSESDDLESSRSQIAAMLPDEGEVPNGLAVIDEQRRTLGVLTQNYSNPEEAIGYFTEIGWQGNVTRTFWPPGGVIISAGMTSSVYVSIHRFGDADGARRALDYSFDDLASAADGAEIEEGGFGDYSRTIRESNDDGNSAAIHVQVGTVFFRVSAVSVDGDPYGDAVDVMNVVLGKI